MKIKKILPLMLIASMLLTSCGEKKEKASVDDDVNYESYPIKTSEKLTY